MRNNKHTEGQMKLRKITGKFPDYSLGIEIEKGYTAEICRLFTATTEEKDQQEANAERIVKCWNRFNEMKQALLAVQSDAKFDGFISEATSKQVTEVLNKIQ